MIIEHTGTGSDGKTYTLLAEHGWVRVPDAENPRRTHRLGPGSWRLEDGRKLTPTGTPGEFAVDGEDLIIRKG